MANQINIEAGTGSDKKITDKIRTGAAAGTFDVDIPQANRVRVEGLDSLGNAIVQRLKSNGVDPGIIDPTNTTIGGKVNTTTPVTTGTTGGRIFTPVGANVAEDAEFISANDAAIARGDGTSFEDGVAARAQALITGEAVTADTDGDGVVTDADAELAAAIDAYIASLQAGNLASEQAAITNIRAEEETALSGEEAARREAEQLYLDALEQIDKGVFDETQRQKVSAQRRGIASSQQAEGIQAGVQREGLGLRFKNEQDRATRLADITDRINNIKNVAQSAITAAGQTRTAADLAAEAQGQQIELQRGFEVEDIERAQEFQLSQQAQDFANQVALIDKNFANTLTKTDVDFQNAFAIAAAQNNWAMTRDAINNASALDRLNISNEHAMNMMGLQQQFQFNMADYNFAKQEIISELDFERTKELAQLSEDSQFRVMDKATEKDKEMIEFQTALNYTTEELYNLAGPTTQQDIIDAAIQDNKWGLKSWEILLPKVFGIEEAALEGMTNSIVNDRLNQAGLDAKDASGLFGGGTAAQQREALDAFKKALGFD